MDTLSLASGRVIHEPFEYCNGILCLDDSSPVPTDDNLLGGPRPCLEVGKMAAKFCCRGGGWLVVLISLHRLPYLN